MTRHVANVASPWREKPLLPGIHTREPAVVPVVPPAALLKIWVGLALAAAETLAFVPLPLDFMVTEVRKEAVVLDPGPFCARQGELVRTGSPLYSMRCRLGSCPRTRTLPVIRKARSLRD